jgi:hypothetical protein
MMTNTCCLGHDHDIDESDSPERIGIRLPIQSMTKPEEDSSKLPASIEGTPKAALKRSLLPESLNHHERDRAARR